MAVVGAHSEIVLARIYGEAPPDACREFVGRMLRFPEAVRQDFVAVVMLELLEEKRLRGRGQGHLPYDAAGFVRVLGRVTKRIQRAAARLVRQKPIVEDPEDRRPSAISADIRMDLEDAVKSFDSTDTRILGMRL